MTVYRTGSISLPCGDTVHLEVGQGGEIDVVIAGRHEYTVDADVAEQLSHAFAEAVSAARQQPSALRFSGRDVVLTGRFYGTRKDLERRLTRAGACVRDYVHTDAVLIKGEPPRQGTFKSRMGSQLGVRSLSAAEAHRELAAAGL